MSLYPRIFHSLGLCMKASHGAQSTGLLEPFKEWLDDPEVSEILINRPNEVWIEKNGDMLRFDTDIDAYHLSTLFRLIANENSQLIDQTHPLFSGNLQDGSRVQLVMPPTARHPTLSIRRKVVKNMNMESYKKTGYFKIAQGYDPSQADNADENKSLIDLYKKNKWQAFILKAIANKKNIIISGGTSSGKTTFLNACLHTIDESERIITLEDAREIDISHPNQVNLIASKGEQGTSQVSMQDLVQCCLRLRPDRIICGEIRGKEILDFLSACSTGHEGSITSIHANNPRVAFMRMTQMYKLNNVPSMTDDDIMRELNEVIDIILQVKKEGAKRVLKEVYYKDLREINDKE